MRLILFIIIVTLIYFFYNYSVIEGFSSDYLRCIKKGFTKEFCVQTPISQFWPGTCQCSDGSIGRYLVGFRGECVCNPEYSNYSLMYS